jgi:hypothetical protein
MDSSEHKVFRSLIERLPVCRELETTAERHIYLLWLITRGVTLLGGERPVLVGGGAVEFYTGIRFATGDLDLIAPDKKLTEEVLLELGFEKPANGRHYVNKSIAALVEIHGKKLKGKELPLELVYKKVPLLLVSPEDCITDRLYTYRKHGSTLDLLNAFLISFHQMDRIDEAHLVDMIHERKLWDFYRPLLNICRELVCEEIGVDEAAAALIQFMKRGTVECAF